MKYHDTVKADDVSVIVNHTDYFNSRSTYCIYIMITLTDVIHIVFISWLLGLVAEGGALKIFYLAETSMSVAFFPPVC